MINAIKNKLLMQLQIDGLLEIEPKKMMYDRQYMRGKLNEITVRIDIMDLETIKIVLTSPELFDTKIYNEEKYFDKVCFNLAYMNKYEFLDKIFALKYVPDINIIYYALEGNSLEVLEVLNRYFRMSKKNVLSITYKCIMNKNTKMFEYVLKNYRVHDSVSVSNIAMFMCEKGMIQIMRRNHMKISDRAYEYSLIEDFA